MRTTTLLLALAMSFTASVESRAQEITPSTVIPCRAGTARAPITSTPKGKLHGNLYRTSSSYVTYYSTTYTKDADGLIGAYVIGEDGNVYIKNPFSQFVTDSWMKGTVAGDTIVVSTPQAIYSYIDNDGPNDYFVWNMKYDEANNTFVRDTDNPDAKFVFRGDTLVQASPGMLGMTVTSGNWIGYGDYNIKMYPVGDEITQKPEGQAQDYTIAYTDEYGEDKKANVQCVIKDNELYLGNFSYETPDSWIKGKIEGNKLVFSSPQYLGPGKSNHHLYFMAGQRVKVWDAENNEYVDTYESCDKIEFAHDGNTYKSDSVMFLNWGRHTVHYRNAYEEPVLGEYMETPATPQDPVIKAFQEYKAQIGYGAIRFNIYKKATTGEELNIKKLFYNIYVDDKVYTFEPKYYPNITEDMTDIPYDFDEERDFRANGDDHIVYFSVKDFKRMGVQSIYKGGNATRKSSIIYNVGEPVIDGVSTVEDDSREVVSEVCCDLAGRQIAEPHRGVYIKTVTFADGSKRNYKMMRQ